MRYLFTAIYGISRWPETGEFAAREVALSAARRIGCSGN